MALLDVTLASGSTETINQENANDGDTISAEVLGSSTLIVDGVDVTVQDIIGVNAGSDLNFVAMNEANLTIDRGLLEVSALNSLSFDIRSDSHITLDSASIEAGTLLTNLLNDFEVNFSGGQVGTFTFDPPDLAVLSAIHFDVNGMQAGDQFIIDGYTLQLDKGLLQPNTAAYNASTGQLSLRAGNPLLGTYTTVHIAMTQEEANLFFSSPGAYLASGTFTFPGTLLCYASGSKILTEDGYRPVHELKAGDRVINKDGRLRQVIWIGASYLDEKGLDLLPNLRPIRIRRNALGRGFPFEDLVVSPQHRILVNGDPIREMGGVNEGLLAAKHLLGIKGVETASDLTEVTYYHLLLRDHDVIMANGLPAETLLIGEFASTRLNHRHRSEIEQLFPEFGKQTEGGAQSTFPLFRGRLSRDVMKKHGAKARHFFRPGRTKKALSRPAHSAQQDNVLQFATTQEGERHR